MANVENANDSQIRKTEEQKVKKLLSLLVVAAMMLATFSACGTANVSKKTKKNKDGKISVVTTIFPEYDWVMNVLGDKKDDVDVRLLLDKGVDLHSFQPTADDILEISKCDMFIYVGGESDEWVDDALKEAVNKDMVVINLLDVLKDDIKEEEVVEGMQAEEEEEESGEAEEEVEYDEHVWLSLKNAAKLVDSMSEGLCTLDEANAEAYKANAAAYVEELNNLDAEYQAAVDASSVKTVLFGDRFPFRYLVDDYGIKYYAAFVGCSAETEASFETVTVLAKKIDEHKLNSVFTIEKSDQKIAKTIIDNTSNKNQKILELDSMQSITADDVNAGKSYISIMQDNLTTLKKAL